MNEGNKPKFNKMQLVGLALWIGFVAYAVFGIIIPNIFLKPVDVIDMKYVDNYAQQNGYDPSTRSMNGSEVCYTKHGNNLEQMCIDFRFADNSTKNITSIGITKEVNH